MIESSARRLVRHLSSAVGEFLLPKVCLGCRSAGSTWCSVCDDTVTGHPFKARNIDGLPVFAATEYQGPVVRLVNLAKEVDSPRAQRLLALLLRNSLRALLSDQLVSEIRHSGELRLSVVPIPTSAKARRRRGGDPLTSIIKRAIAEDSLDLLYINNLTNARARDDQSGLTIEQRERNVAGSFVWRPGVAARADHFIIADDVITTGATLREAIAAMRAGGAPVLGAAVVSATRRRVHCSQGA